MLRAKTLLAGIVVTVTAVTVFALNADHEGFVPDATNKQATTPLDLPTDTSKRQAITQIPKLAPIDTANTALSNAQAKTKAEIPPLGTARATTSDANTERTTLNAPSPTPPEVPDSQHGDAQPPQTVVKAIESQTFAALPSGTEQTTAHAVGMPIPVRLPQEVRALRHLEAGRTAASTGVGSDDLVLDPAITDVSQRATRRLKQRRRAARLRRQRRRTARRASANTNSSQSELISAAPKPKPRRHRKPFDHNRN